jgi:hypothetical protein
MNTNETLKQTNTGITLDTIIEKFVPIIGAILLVSGI